MSKLLTLGVVQQGTLLNQSEPPDAAPTGLALTVVDRTDIKLDWTDNATNEDGYKIERSLNGVDFTVIDTVVADTETYTDEDLDEFTQYYYRVRAYKGEEYSNYTDVKNETTGSPAFIITVDTTKAGSANDTFVLPTTGAGYDAYVDWGDGGELQNITGTPGNVSHQYASSGTYQIKITGTFPRIYFNNAVDKLKLIYIDNWGDIVWSSMESAFQGCSSMQGNWSDTPDLSVVTSVRFMWAYCSKFNSLINDWNFSNIENMYAFLINCSIYNKTLNGIDTSNVTNLSYAFYNMDLFKQTLSYLDISSCTNFASLMNTDMNETSTTTNYDNTLISWAEQTVSPNENCDFGLSKYGQGKVDEGTTDGTTSDKLVDSSQNFLTTVTVGDVIHNTTDGTYARVTAVDSDTQLSLDNDIMASGEDYVVQHSDAAKARASLVLDDGWTITDGGAA